MDKLRKKIFGDLCFEKEYKDDIFKSLFSNCKQKDISIECKDLDNIYFDENQQIYYVYENKYFNDKDTTIPYENIISIQPYDIKLCSDLYEDIDDKDINDQYVVGNMELPSVDSFSNFISCHLLIKNYLDDTFCSFFIKNDVTIYYVDNNIPIWIKYLITSYKAYHSNQYQIAFSMGYISFDSFITLVNKEINNDKRKNLSYHKRMIKIDKLLGGNNWLTKFNKYRECRNDLLHGNNLDFNIDSQYYENFILQFYKFMKQIYVL